jgi:pimeloyl-ACP methyl ester carboxylesterase
VGAADDLEAVWLGPRPGQAATLVFLHDGLGCVATWRDFPARLAAATGLGALVWSRIGHGGSPPAPAPPRALTYMHEEAAGVGDVLDRFGIERAVLVGHSDGGSIALIHAGAHDAGGRVLGLALEAPHVFCEPLSVAGIEAARAAFEHGELRVRLERHHGANTDNVFWGWNRAWLDQGFLAWNIEAYLARVRAPVLVVQGLRDEFGTLAQVLAIERGAAAPVTCVMLGACGHAPHRERPDETLEAMATFVRGLGLDQGGSAQQR